MKFLILILVALFFISCKNDEEQELPQEPYDLSTSIIPLTIGNEWQYIVNSDGDKYLLNIIVDTKKLIDNVVYFELKITDSRNKSKSRRILLRGEDDGSSYGFGGTYYLLENGKEYKLFEERIFTLIFLNIYKEEMDESYNYNIYQTEEIAPEHIEGVDALPTTILIFKYSKFKFNSNYNLTEKYLGIGIHYFEDSNGITGDLIYVKTKLVDWGIKKSKI